jgi:hypothetical protein
VKIINGGTEGAAGVKFTSVYFEKNKGSADVNIDHTVNNCVYSFDTCTFNRISSTDFVTNNISVAAGGTASICVDVKSSGFQAYGSYVENSGRKYIAVSGLSNAAVTVDDGRFPLLAQRFRCQGAGLPQNQVPACTWSRTTLVRPLTVFPQHRTRPIALEWSALSLPRTRLRLWSQIPGIRSLTTLLCLRCGGTDMARLLLSLAPPQGF